MSSCDVAPRKVNSGSSSSWSWATLNHQLLSTAAGYGGHDVVILGSSGFFMEMMLLFFGQTTSDGRVVGYDVGQ